MHCSAWHGGRAYFVEFSEDAIRSGESDALGWGFYFAGHRKGGEYFAEYLNSRDGIGYLYEVQLDLPEDRVLPLDSQYSEINPLVQSRISQVFRGKEINWGVHSAYCALRDELGDKGASSALRDVGILALTAYENTKPGHGITYLILDKACITLTRIFKFSKNPYGWQPLLIP